MDVITQHLFNTAKKIRELLPKLHQEAQKVSSQVETAAAEYHADRAQRQPAQIMRAELHRSQAEIDNEQAHRTRTEGRDEKRLGIEALALWVAAAMLVINVVIAITYIGLWIETKHATKIAAISADAAEKSAGASEAQAKTAQAQTEVTRKSAEITLDTFRQEQRAWVGPTNVRFAPALSDVRAPNPIGAVTTITNSGKTPAINTSVTYILHASDTPLNIEDYAKHPVEQGKASEKGVFSLFPNAIMELAAATGSTDELGIQSVRNGRKILYFFGRINYEDVSGNRHVTKFCSRYYPSVQGWGTCDSYNSTN